MKNHALVLAASCLFVIATGCHRKPIVGQNDPVKSNYVHKYGVEVDDAADWQERGSSGKVIKKLKNGSTLTENWQDGALSGPSTLTFPHSTVICSETVYENDVCIKQTSNYNSGMPKKQSLYNSKPYVLVSTWYEDGLPQSQEKYQDVRLVSGKYFTPKQDLESEIDQGQGTRPIRDGYGELKGTELFSDGLLTTKIEFYPNGMPKNSTPYIQGAVQGIRRTFSPSGAPETIEEWNNDSPNGTTILFQNAERVAEIPFLNGQKHGIEHRFRVGTDVIAEDISWANNLRHGPSIVYVDDQKITDWYFEGKKVSRAEFIEHNK